jgi:superfamily I DNA/RNA helicase
MSRTPTKQQKACIKAVRSNPHQMLQIRAGAGSGKTSTLNMAADEHPVPSLYLAFNKVTAEEAAERFPEHVTCRTTHSVAYEVFGRKLSHKLSRPKKYTNVAGTGLEISRYYGIESYENTDKVVAPAGFIGMLAKQTVARFEQSADESIEYGHVPKADLRTKFGENESSIRRVANTALEVAMKLWKDRIDLNSPVLATHDTYLKQYQLSKPDIGNYQVLYVDEFQDTSPCVMDIVLRQRDKMKVVMVGDRRQAIYGWRGAINAMEETEQHCKVENLTKSFRFGKEVARVATAVLERDMVIEGFEKIESVVGLEHVVDRSEPHTRLFRTNTALLAAAMAEIAAGTEVRIEIDMNDFCRLLQSAEALSRGDMKQVKHEKLLPYENWKELLGDKDDMEVSRIAKIVEDGKATEWINLLENFKNSVTPLVTFTTAHKSKGREWTQVIVEDDFKSCYKDGKWVGLTVEEQNLLYVVVTRAIERLEYNKTVAEYLNHTKGGAQFDRVFAQMLHEGPGNGHDLVVLEAAEDYA